MNRDEANALCDTAEQIGHFELEAWQRQAFVAAMCTPGSAKVTVVQGARLQGASLHGAVHDEAVMIADVATGQPAIRRWFTCAFDEVCTDCSRRIPAKYPPTTPPSKRTWPTEVLCVRCAACRS